MHVRTHHWSPASGWNVPLSADTASAQLVISLGPVQAPPADWFTALAAHAPQAQHVYASGGGQFHAGALTDEATIVSFLTFASTRVIPIVLDGVTKEASAALGATLGQQLSDLPGLRHVLLFAEGITFNADAFLDTLNPALPPGVRVSGGLASNGTALTESVVGLNAPPERQRLVAIGLAGDDLMVGTGSAGGWDHFGPERVVTRASIAAVHELDGERALDVYTRYLGAFATELPGSALLFPLAVRRSREAPVAVRTVLGIDEATGTLFFAGDIPEGSLVRLMRTTPDKLADGAAHAAALADPGLASASSRFTFCVSCIGRRAVMRSRAEEELDEVMRSAGSSTVVGFYSNGEIAPPHDGAAHTDAVLHNQTMTVTTLAER
jgi:hypothetical protein